LKFSNYNKIPQRFSSLKNNIFLTILTSEIESKLAAKFKKKFNSIKISLSNQTSSRNMEFLFSILPTVKSIPTYNGEPFV